MRRFATILIALGLLILLLGTLSVPRPPRLEVGTNQRHRGAMQLASTPDGRTLGTRGTQFADVDPGQAVVRKPLDQVAPPLPAMRMGQGRRHDRHRAGPWTADQLLADPTHMNDQHVSVVANPATGHLFAAFEARDLGGDDRDIHLAWSHDGGVTWQQTELQPSSLDEYQPDLALDDAGYLHVVWARADGALVRARSAGPEDVHNWSLVRVFEVGEPVAVPSIAVSGSGDFARVFIACCWYTINWNWYQYEYTLLWLYSTNGGQTVAYNYLEPDGLQDLWPDVGLSGSTATMVNGEQDFSTGRIRILAARGAISGAFVDYVDLTQSTAMSSGYPSVAVDGENNYVVWQQDWDDGLGNVDGDVMYAFSWDGLASVYGPYEIQATIDESVGPVVATAGGRVCCWWLEAPAGGDEFHLSARAASLDGHPEGWGRQEFITDLPMVVPQFRAGAGAVGSDSLVAVWIDRRDYATQGYNVYTSRRGLTPDLAPYVPEGWSDALITSLVPGQRQDGELAPGLTTYASFAVANLGLAPATEPFALSLQLDGQEVARWNVPDGLDTGSAVAVEDHELLLDPGAHTLSLIIDPDQAVAEANEADNQLDEDLWVPSGNAQLVMSPASLQFHAETEPEPATELVDARHDPVIGTRLQQALDRSAPGSRLRVVVAPRHRLSPESLGAMARPDALAMMRARAGQLATALQPRAGVALRPLWLSGEVVGELTPDEVLDLASRHEVGGLWLDDQQSEFRAAPASPVVLSRLLGAAGAESGRAVWPLEDLGVPAAWAQGLDGTGVLVGHTDSGVAWDHPDLVGRMWDGRPDYPHHGYDFIDEDDDPYDPGEGDFWHGTHTAGLVVGRQHGAAPGARLLATRCVPGYYEDMVQALQFCLDQGCHVISTSAGWTGASEALRSANRINAEVLLAVGVVWVVAAGNGDDAGGHLPVPQDISSPGDCPNPWYGTAGHSAVITVGALTQGGTVWSSSSRGPTGWAVSGDDGHDDYPYPPGLIKPDVVAPGANVESTVGGGGYASYSGTSMATPLVAGSVALLLQQNPALMPSEVAEALEISCIDLGPAGRDPDHGAGRVHVPGALAALPSGQAAVVQVRNLGTVPLLISDLSVNQPWLTATLAGDLVAPQDSVRLTVAWDAAGLAEGGYPGTVRLVSNDPAGTSSLPVTLVVGAATGIEPLAEPPRTRLAVFPNPFNPRTTVSFALPEGGHTRLTLYDARGRRICRLLDAELSAGHHDVLWDGRDHAGRPCAAGIYLARLESSAGVSTGRLALVR